MPARLFASKDAGLEAPFSTYLPEDLAASSGVDSIGEFVRFTAQFGGHRNVDAYLQITFLPAGADSTQAGVRLDRAIHALAPREIESIERPHRWTQLEFLFSRAGEGGAQRGWVALARHGAHWFYVVQASPEEFAEGLGTRVEALWREWRWEDTGDSL